MMAKRSWRWAVIPAVVLVAVFFWAVTSSKAVHCDVEREQGGKPSPARMTFDIDYARKTIDGRPAIISETRISWQYSTPTADGKGTEKVAAGMSRIDGSMFHVRRLQLGDGSGVLDEAHGTCPAVIVATGKAPEEVAAVTSDVVANGEWVADLKTCPADLAPAGPKGVAPTANLCRRSLQACLLRCQADDATSCYWLAYELQRAGVDGRASEALHQHACKLGVVSGCTNRAAGRKGDEPCAARTFARTCELDDPWGCTMYALHLAEGKGVSKDKPKALEVLRKSCKYGPEDEACAYGNRLKGEIERGER